MATIRLKVSDQVVDKVLWLLQHFSPEELEIIRDNEEFQKNQEYLQSELNRMKEGSARYYTIDEANSLLEGTISKNED